MGFKSPLSSDDLYYTGNALCPQHRDPRVVGGVPELLTEGSVPKGNGMESHPEWEVPHPSASGKLLLSDSAAPRRQPRAPSSQQISPPCLVPVFVIQSKLFMAYGHSLDSYFYFFFFLHLK